MKHSLEVGQFWLDQVNKDLLRIKGFSDYQTGDGVWTRYAQCSCFVRGYYFGVQEMKTSHFEEDRRDPEPQEFLRSDLPRFKQLSWMGGYWTLFRTRLRTIWNQRS